MGDDEILQVKCWTGDEGHVWMDDFDVLPISVRRRLRNSPFNLCAACLVTFFLPKVRSGQSRERALLTAIEIMESQVRRDQKQREGSGRRQTS
jgi:hypothetical protein